MTLYDFLKHPDMQLPSQWDSCKDFEAYFGSRLAGFLTLIEKLKPDFVSDEVHKRKHTIISFCNELRRWPDPIFCTRGYESWGGRGWAEPKGPLDGWSGEAG